MGIKESLIASLAVELSVVLVETGGVEGLAAGLALDADLVEGSSVHGHHRLGRVDRGLAGRAPGGRGGSRPAHPTTTTTVRPGDCREGEGAGPADLFSVWEGLEGRTEAGAGQGG